MESLKSSDQFGVVSPGTLTFSDILDHLFCELFVLEIGLAANAGMTAVEIPAAHMD
jgi:hypothetical protein